MFYETVITVQFAEVCNKCTISLVSGKRTITCNRCPLTIKCQKRQFCPLLCVSMNAKTCFCPKIYMLSFCIEYDIGWTICEFVSIHAVVPRVMEAYRGTEVIYTGLFDTLQRYIVGFMLQHPYILVPQAHIKYKAGGMKT